ncbi:MAG TPA: GGDEF domain-containing protein [Anaerolineales bacterium]|nr:GGDEF domain-containing protein [Anaerolineales bacterium]
MNKQQALEALEKKSPLFWIVTGTLMIGLIGAVDYLTGNEINISLFYLAPIVLVTWWVGQTAGLFMSLFSALAWLVAEFAIGLRYSSSSLYFWNTLIRSGFFVIVTYLVAELHKLRREEQLAARTDFVSGAVNGRYFHELLQMEIERIRRYPHPITIVYIDVDNFKLVNDLYGHTAGDEVLRCIATALQSHLRSTDTIARVGGDEFALLLPSTHQSEAQMVLSKLRVHLGGEMRNRNVPVTFSMGALTCAAPPHSAEQLMNMADELMYEVKNSTKNDVRFSIWAGTKSGK